MLFVLVYIYYDLVAYLKMTNPHCRPPSLDCSKNIFTMRILCWMVGLKVQRWCKYVFNHGVGECILQVVYWHEF